MADSVSADSAYLDGQKRGHLLIIHRVIPLRVSLMASPERGPTGGLAPAHQAAIMMAEGR